MERGKEGGFATNAYSGGKRKVREEASGLWYDVGPTDRPPGSVSPTPDSYGEERAGNNGRGGEGMEGERSQTLVLQVAAEHASEDTVRQEAGQKTDCPLCQKIFLLR